MASDLRVDDYYILYSGGKISGESGESAEKKKSANHNRELCILYNGWTEYQVTSFITQLRSGNGVGLCLQALNHHLDENLR
jgi:hypothetical protein